jgi:hypothetical protein
MDITIRAIQEHELDAVVTLNRNEYGEAFFTNTDWYRRRFFDKLIRGILIGAFKNDRLIGHTGLTVSPYLCHGKICNIGLTESSLIDPEFRLRLIRDTNNLKSIFQLLLESMHTEALNFNCDAVIGFPNSSSYPVFINQFDYTMYGYYDFAFMPIDFKACIELKNNSILHMLKPFMPLAQCIYNTIKIRKPHSTHTCNSRMHLGTTSPVDTPFTLERPKAYLQWRLITNPVNYKCCTCYKKNTPVGCCYWKTNSTLDNESGKKLFFTKIVDLWIDNSENRKTIATSLLHHVRESAINAGSAFIFSCLKTNPEGRSWFTHNGFFWFSDSFFSKKIPVVVKTFGSLNIPPLSDWHISMIDNDII